MCERTCPVCRCTTHSEGFGVVGGYIDCDRCGTRLCWRADIEAARTDLTEEQAEQWARERTGVLPGAEAINPADDELWSPRP